MTLHVRPVVSWIASGGATFTFLVAKALSTVGSPGSGCGRGVTGGGRAAARGPPAGLRSARRRLEADDRPGVGAVAHVVDVDVHPLLAADAQLVPLPQRLAVDGRRVAKLDLLHAAVA